MKLTIRGTWNSHHDECRTDDDGLDATAEDGVRDDGQRLVGDHVREEKGDQKEVAVLTNRLDLVGVLLLFPEARSQTCMYAHKDYHNAYAVPLMLSTFSCVSSSDM